MADAVLANLCKYMRGINFDELEAKFDEPENRQESTTDESSENKSQASSVVQSQDQDVTCDDCGGTFSIQNGELLCSGCGIIETCDESVINESSMISYRIKIVGKDGGQFQHDLDKSAPVNMSAMRKQSVLKELMAFNYKFANNGGNYFPGNILKTAAEKFNQLQDYYVKRGVEKRRILAVLIYHAFLEHGYHREKKEIANFVELPTRAMSKGDVTIRTAISEGKIDMKISTDTTLPHVKTLFDKISGILNNPDKYKDAVMQIAAICDKNLICSGTQMKSKVSGILIYILQTNKMETEKAKVMEKIEVRSNTIKKVIADLDEYDAYFEDIIAKLKGL